MAEMTEAELLKRKLAREQRARHEAEVLLEEKSAALYEAKQSLEASNAGKEQYLQILADFALAITEIETVDELAWYVARKVVGRLGFSDCVVYLYDPESHSIIQAAAIADKNPTGEEIVNKLSIPVGQGITGTVAATMKPEIISDVSKDDRYITDVAPGGSEVCVPMVHNGELLGVIDCEDQKIGAFHAKHLETLETIAFYTSAKIAERYAQREAAARTVELEAKVDELTQLSHELEIAKEKAEETSALKSRFVATISHEIRTPLAGILGSLDLLQDEVLPEAADALVGMARDSGLTLQTLLNDVIDFARSEAGTLQVEPAAFSIEELVTSLQSFWFPHMQAKGASLEFDIHSATEPAYWGDPARIRQVLNNFLSNALKYAPGRVVLGVEPNSAKNAVRFSVRDFGKGLSEEDQAQLFTEFTRVGSHKRQIGDGAGLGLAICRQMAELMDGTTGVESAPGDGAKFWLQLPLKEAALPERTRTKTASELTPFDKLVGRKPRVLVAEDVPTNQTLIRMTLESFGCRVSIANNGVEAVDAARKHRFDIVFMDIAMPEMDGTEATARICEELGPELAPPIYALTAHGMDSDRKEFEAAGMIGIVTKPFDRHDLYQAIETSLSEQGSMASDHSAEQPFQETTVHPEFDEAMVVGLLGALDEESQLMLLNQCTIDLSEGLKSLQSAFENKDHHQMGETAHRLKSVGGTFGLVKLQHLTSDATDAARTGNEAVCETLTAEILGLLPDGIAKLKVVKSKIENGEAIQ
ncbi:MAG: response regulator [Kordiimonadaceae bacterium]|nr:response regulator [Kordiimonadaceae bacterium]MBO6570774.1 response regulator [Kordiimonadaceae bacterium]MBO6965455.1 response regulator [Kordiimonadaceae bacterium]